MVILQGRIRPAHHVTIDCTGTCLPSPLSTINVGYPLCLTSWPSHTRTLGNFSLSAAARAGANLLAFCLRFIALHLWMLSRNA